MLGESVARACAREASPSERERAQREVAEAVVKSPGSLIELVGALGPFLTTTDARSRAHGQELLALAVCALHASPIDAGSLHHLVRFFTDRLDDIPSIHSSLIGLHALVRRELSAEALGNICEALAARLHVPSLAQADRRAAYEAMHALIEVHALALQRAGLVASLIVGVTKAVEGEKDPRNLLVTFALVRAACDSLTGAEADPPLGSHAAPGSLPLEPQLDELFDVLGCYFPIRFAPPPNDSVGISQAHLASAWHRAICAPALRGRAARMLAGVLADVAMPPKLDAALALAAVASELGCSALAPVAADIALQLSSSLDFAPASSEEAAAAVRAFAAVCAALASAAELSAPGGPAAASLTESLSESEPSPLRTFLRALLETSVPRWLSSTVQLSARIMPPRAEPGAARDSATETPSLADPGPEAWGWLGQPPRLPPAHLPSPVRLACAAAASCPQAALLVLQSALPALARLLAPEPAACTPPVHSHGDAGGGGGGGGGESVMDSPMADAAAAAVAAVPISSAAGLLLAEALSALLEAGAMGAGQLQNQHGGLPGSSSGQLALHELRLLHSALQLMSAPTAPSPVRLAAIRSRCALLLGPVGPQTDPESLAAELQALAAELAPAGRGPAAGGGVAAAATAQPGAVAREGEDLSVDLSGDLSMDLSVDLSVPAARSIGFALALAQQQQQPAPATASASAGRALAEACVLPLAARIVALASAAVAGAAGGGSEAAAAADAAGGSLAHALQLALELCSAAHPGTQGTAEPAAQPQTAAAASASASRPLTGAARFHLALAMLQAAALAAPAAVRQQGQGPQCVRALLEGADSILQARPHCPLTRLTALSQAAAAPATAAAATAAAGSEGEETRLLLRAAGQVADALLAQEAALLSGAAPGPAPAGDREHPRGEGRVAESGARSCASSEAALGCMEAVACVVRALMPLLSPAGQSAMLSAEAEAAVSDRAMADALISQVLHGTAAAASASASASACDCLTSIANKWAPDWLVGPGGAYEALGARLRLLAAPGGERSHTQDTAIHGTPSALPPATERGLAAQSLASGTAATATARPPPAHPVLDAWLAISRGLSVRAHPAAAAAPRLLLELCCPPLATPLEPQPLALAAARSLCALADASRPARELPLRFDSDAGLDGGSAAVPQPLAVGPLPAAGGALVSPVRFQRLLALSLPALESLALPKPKPEGGAGIAGQLPDSAPLLLVLRAVAAIVCALPERAVQAEAERLATTLPRALALAWAAHSRALREPNLPAASPVQPQPQPQPSLPELARALGDADCAACALKALLSLQRAHVAIAGRGQGAAGSAALAAEAVASRLCDHAAALVELLTATAAGHSAMAVRLLALECVDGLRLLPYATVFPLRRPVADKLRPALSDRKRRVRIAAANVRGRWFESAGSGAI